MCNGTPFTVEKISPRAGLEPGTARSVGQRLTNGATEAPLVLEDHGADYRTYNTWRVMLDVGQSPIKAEYWSNIRHFIYMP